MKNLRPISAFVLAICWTGCSPKQPNKQALGEYIAPALPPLLSLKEIDLETSPSGEGSFHCKYGLTVAPNEDLYKKEPSKLGVEIQANLLDRMTTGELSQSVFQAANNAIMDFQTENPMLTRVAQKGTSVVIYGTVMATSTEKTWNWADSRFQPAPVLDALPRSAFSANALVAGSSEAVAAETALQKDIQEIETAEKGKIEKAAAEKAAQDQKAATELAVRKQRLLVLFRPGNRLTGSVISERWPDPVELIVDEDGAPNGQPLKFRLSNPQDKGMYRDFVGAVNGNGLADSRVAVASASGSKPVGDFKDPRGLFGPAHTIYSKMDSASVSFYLTETGLRGEFSGYGGPIIELRQQP